MAHQGAGSAIQENWQRDPLHPQRFERLHLRLYRVTRSPLVIEKRPDGRFRVRLYYRSRYVASRTFARKTEAIKWEREQKSALASGTWIDVSAHESVTVAEWGERWLATKNAGKPSAVIDRRTSLRFHVTPRFGRLPLSAVRPSEVAEWATTLATLKSPSTARRALAALRLTFDLAIRDGAASRNPALGIRLPAQQAGEPHPLTHAQLWQLVEAMPTERDRVLILVLGYGGLRWGEATALRGRCVGPTGVLRLTEAWSEVGGKLHLGDLKSHSARSVPLPSTVARRLAAWVVGRNPDELLFHGSNPLSPIRNSNFRHRIFDPAILQIGFGHVTPHNLRDTAASLAIQAGASVVTVSRLLGHNDVSTTLKHYAGMFPSDLDQVAILLDVGAQLENARYKEFLID